MSYMEKVLQRGTRRQMPTQVSLNGANHVERADRDKRRKRGMRFNAESTRTCDICKIEVRLNFRGGAENSAQSKNNNIDCYTLSSKFFSSTSWAPVANNGGECECIIHRNPERRVPRIIPI
jgi:hypothetical protein